MATSPSSCRTTSSPTTTGWWTSSRRLAAELGLPTAVTNEVHYAEPGGHRLQDVLVCIRHGATLTEARELLLTNAEYRLKTGAELAAIGAGAAGRAQPRCVGGRDGAERRHR